MGGGVTNASVVAGKDPMAAGETAHEGLHGRAERTSFQQINRLNWRSLEYKEVRRDYRHARKRTRLVRRSDWRTGSLFLRMYVQLRLQLQLRVHDHRSRRGSTSAILSTHG
jgi:hypothetical protein